MNKPFSAILLDVGGTLWPDVWMPREADHKIRAERLHHLLPKLSPQRSLDLTVSLQANASSLEHSLIQDTATFIYEAAKPYKLETSKATLTKILEAMCLPAIEHTCLFPGTVDLLSGGKALGLKCVVISNVVYRSSSYYLRDFKDFGIARYIDGVISSLDEGFRKPHPAIFEAALKLAGFSPEEAIILGNSERNDIAPAVALGMRAILACIEAPPPEKSQANAVVTSLPEALDVIKTWVAA